MNLDQAREITTAVDALPTLVGIEDRLRAEEHLLAEARVHDASALRRLGKHLVDVIDPDGADKPLAKALEAEEKGAARRTFLTVTDDGDGRFRIPKLHVAMLRTGLQKLLSPARPDPIPTTGRPRDQALGEAFCQLLEAKVRATVVVTLPLETLLGGIKAAHLDTGQALSPSLARRLACAAGVIPAVLGTDSEVLDLGRKARLHTPKQRLAMNVQQHGTCAVEDCTRPASWADGHHLTQWSEGGETSVTDGVLICPRHHTLAYLPRYQLQPIKPGRVRLVRRQ